MDSPLTNSTRASFLTMPWCFLGLGLWRSWIMALSERFSELSIAGPLAFADCQDLLIALCLIALAAFSRKIVPLGEKRVYQIACAVAAFVSIGSLACGLAVQQVMPFCTPVALIASSVASALFILLWCETYSCLPPLKVALYYAVSFVLGAGLGYVLSALPDTQLMACLICLPPIILAAQWRSYHSLPPADHPKALAATPAFPIKLVALMAVFQFAYGLRAEQIPSVIGELSWVGDVIIGVMLLVYILFLAGRFSLAVLYRTPAVLLVAALLLVPVTGAAQNIVAGICITVSLKLVEAVVFLLLCDYCRRFGASAVFVFGIEEASVVFRVFGNQSSQALLAQSASISVSETTLTVLIIALVIVAFFLLLREHEISVWWGASFLSPGWLKSDASEQARLVLRCTEISKRYSLTPREDEVFQLLARGKNVHEIEDELFIAEGTVKAHTRHIYEKLGIHTKTELTALLAIDENRAEPAS